MAKKKKKKELDPSLMPFFLPGSIATHMPPALVDKVTFPPGWSLDKITTQPDAQLVAGAFMAFYEYTFGGAVEMMAAKSITQGTVGFSLGAGGVYGTLGTAVAFELAMDFLIIGAIATAIDPQHRWAGGLDETNWYKQNIKDERGWFPTPEHQRNVWRDIGYQ